ncbi:hypothetical protein RB196_06325 [Streptomyces sp. PmtA]|uniref:hypothetical protein n=1 Tax=Streptomyces sp. PmtA TaxID=3074275 RepID=UPI003014EED4
MDAAAGSRRGSRVRDVAPAPLRHVQEAGWDLLAFEDIVGRQAVYVPGSDDLPLVVDVMTRLGEHKKPDIVMRSVPDRMKNHSPTPELFAGDMLLHTDWFPTNVLIAQDRAVLVDWALETSYGAGWSDPALQAVWLIREGHPPRKAERRAFQVPAWATYRRMV